VVAAPPRRNVRRLPQSAPAQTPTQAPAAAPVAAATSFSISKKPPSSRSWSITWYRPTSSRRRARHRPQRLYRPRARRSLGQRATGSTCRGRGSPGVPSQGYQLPLDAGAALTAPASRRPRALPNDLRQTVRPAERGASARRFCSRLRAPRSSSTAACRCAVLDHRRSDRHGRACSPTRSTAATAQAGWN